MADHYRITRALLDEVAQLETDLAAAYRSTHASGAMIADLHQRLGRTLKKASIHSNLAIAQVHMDRPISA